MRNLLRPFNLFLAMLLLFSIISKTYACTGKDIVFTNITITSIVDGTYYYSYDIKNIGTEDIVLGQVVIQNYVSTDNQVGSDAPAGGAFASFQSTDILSPGETYNGTFEASPFPQNPQSSYPYLLPQVYLNSDDECDKSNNYFAEFIQVSTAIAKPSQIAKATLNWDMENRIFTVRDWSGNKSKLHYSLYSASGVLILNGSTQKNESTPIKSLNNGVYILHLSDGENVYSTQITYY
ncbi:MAG: T9SS type A sorting domain-containing protein [Sporocytophaga sp.]|uniref:T9SS type A sorting domain-containing protein n=1 Tax=Sporocytophaga sp. TaxID=2231183 RepID=UPI001B19D62C|nr:T9SS type A sorting domain-containing protein [Sporocytophaga sp.]MBO9702233.1 T9SS type A sorting domain-containing protein [Sporocytophaga sp.]